MKKLYSLTVRIAAILITIIVINQGVAMSMQQHVGLDTSKSRTVKTPDSRIYSLTSYNSAANKSGYIALKSGANTISGFNLKGLQQDPDIGLNLKIYPVPVSDQINMSYHLSKETNVIIEIIDLLGSKISTLLSKRKPAGEQKESFPINSKISHGGIYFIRVTAGNQRGEMRISVL